MRAKASHNNGSATLIGFAAEIIIIIIIMYSIFIAHFQNCSMRFTISLKLKYIY